MASMLMVHFWPVFTAVLAAGNCRIASGDHLHKQPLFKAPILLQVHSNTTLASSESNEMLHAMGMLLKQRGFVNMLAQIDGSMGRPLSDSELAAIQNITQVVNESIIPGIFQDRKEKQDSLSQLSHTLQICNDELLAVLRDNVSGLLGATVSLDEVRQAHITCRLAQGDLWQANNTAWKAYQRFLVNLVAPDVQIPEPRQPSSAMAAYFDPARNPYVAWFSSKSDDYMNHHTESANLSIALRDKTEACDRAQLEFEISFCSWLSLASTTSTMYRTCRTEALRNLLTAIDNSSIQESYLRAQYIASQKVLCYFSVLSTPASAQSAKLKECQNLSVDASFLNITAPPMVPELDVLPKGTNTTLWPGQDEWWQQEYGSLPPHVQLAPVQPCPLAVTSTTSTTTSFANTGYFDVCAGPFHTLAIKADGSLWSWGKNLHGQVLGSNMSKQGIPLRSFSSGIQGCGAGNTKSFVIKGSGELWEWGLDNWNASHENYRTPSQRFSSHIRAVAAGSGHILAVSQDGALWAWGSNYYGQLGDASNMNQDIPVEIYSNGVRAVAAGDAHTLVVKEDGSLWTCGNNRYGQLGDSSTFDSNSLKQIMANSVNLAACGSDHSVIVKDDGSLWGWGRNNYGQLGLGIGSSDPVLIPSKSAILSNVKLVAVGSFHGVVLKQDGSVYTFGYAIRGQLGDGSSGVLYKTNAVQVFSGSIVKVAAGGESTFALHEDGSLWGWGENGYGQVGNGGDTNYNVLQPVAINNGSFGPVPDLSKIA
eukprot:TRINITY_DN106998_c0_g1_i1.p1 TRINITY_DN106998_c0_g1~~TRINITY_DN106998_c0_g1_i1.p1  ORF type:complete len:763 (-),score=124.31 TRINITY_DN106998_c0_g1_i1:192-2480(-)